MNNCLKRAVRTFFQAFFGFVSANAIVSFQSAEGLSLKTVAVGLITSAVAAGAAAVMNLKEDKND